MISRIALLLAALCIPTAAFAQASPSDCGPSVMVQSAAVSNPCGQVQAMSSPCGGVQAYAAPPAAAGAQYLHTDNGTYVKVAGVQSQATRFRSPTSFLLSRRRRL